MADFKTPNLCGANESLNNASSKIEDLISELDAKVTSAASEAAAALNTKIADVKAGLDELAVDLPEAKPVNLQSEITSLINDVDRTTAEGIAAFNAKVAELKKDFGEAIGDKGLDLDKLIDEGTTKLGKDIGAAATAVGDVVTDITGAVTDTYSSVTDAVSGGISNISSGLGISGVPGNISEALPTTTTATATNLCDFIPNLEIPADASGTGVTTKEIEDRVSNATTLTLSETPKEILEVQGKKTTQSFFTNIQYTQNGKIIVPKATGTYDTIKAKYTVSLITEKPVAAKQADVPAEAEEFSTIIKNVSTETIKTELKAKVESVKTGEVFVKADPVKDVEPVVIEGGKTVEVTTVNKSVTVEPTSTTTTTASTTTTTTTTSFNPNNPNNLSREQIREQIYGKPKKRKTQSDKGLASSVGKMYQQFVLKGSINEELWDNRRHKVVDDMTNIKLYAKTPFKILYMTAYIETEAAVPYKQKGYKPAPSSIRLRFSKSKQKRNKENFIGELDGQQLIIKDGSIPLNAASITKLFVKYSFYNNVDPNYSG